MMPTQLSKKLIDRYSELVESFYFELPDNEIIGSSLQSDEEEAPGAASATSSGKNVCSKNRRSEKMLIVTFVQSLLLRELKISEATLSIPPL